MLRSVVYVYVCAGMYVYIMYVGLCMQVCMYVGMEVHRYVYSGYLYVLVYEGRKECMHEGRYVGLSVCM